VAGERDEGVVGEAEGGAIGEDDAGAIGEAEAGAIGEDDAGAIGEVEADAIGDEEVASSGERTAAGSDTPVGAMNICPQQDDRQGGTQDQGAEKTRAKKTREPNSRANIKCLRDRHPEIEGFAHPRPGFVNRGNRYGWFVRALVFRW
jgi:hypothetical protein